MGPHRQLIIGAAFTLSACGPYIHTVVPNGLVSAGQIQHTSISAGTLEIYYAGERYSGHFVSDTTHRVGGEHQRFPGRIAQSVLVASGGDKLVCTVEWPRAGIPSGSCTDKTGESFDVRFY